MKKKRNRPATTHKLEQNCLYKLSSPHLLAKYLYTTPIAMKALSDKFRMRYRYWVEKKKNGGDRPISAPFDELKRVQSRLAYILHGITLPDYVFAPVKGRSYVDNGKAHRNHRAFCLLDIEDFYPSCTEEKVVGFFSNIMKCDLDIAVTLARLVCDKGSLPQGSPTSPILAYLAYSEMWDAIHAHAIASGNVFSLYADDLTISGDCILGSTIWKIKKEVHKHGLRLKSDKEQWIFGRPALVTGTITGGGKVRLPNCQHKKLAIAKAEFSRPGGNRKKKGNVFRGRAAQAQQVLNYGDSYRELR